MRSLFIKLIFYMFICIFSLAPCHQMFIDIDKMEIKIDIEINFVFKQLCTKLLRMKEANKQTYLQLFAHTRKRTNINVNNPIHT